MTSSEIFHQAPSRMKEIALAWSRHAQAGTSGSAGPVPRPVSLAAWGGDRPSTPSWWGRG